MDAVPSHHERLSISTSLQCQLALDTPGNFRGNRSMRCARVFRQQFGNRANQVCTRSRHTLRNYFQNRRNHPTPMPFSQTEERNHQFLPRNRLPLPGLQLTKRESNWGWQPLRPRRHAIINASVHPGNRFALKFLSEYTCATEIDRSHHQSPRFDICRHAHQF